MKLSVSRFPSSSGGRLSSGSRPGFSGFTLIEILVVVAIIGVLVALLIPAFASAKRAQGGVQCLSNLRQIGTAYLGYVEEHRGYGPPHWGNPFWDPNSPSETLLWTGHIAPYLDEANVAEGRLSPIFDCPLDPDVKSRPPNRGYVSTAENWAISYGYNYYFLTSQKNFWDKAPDQPFTNFRSVQNLTTLVLVADDIPRSQGGWSTSLIDASSSAVARGPDARHQGKIQAVFADGHAGSLEGGALDRKKNWYPKK